MAGEERECNCDMSYGHSAYCPNGRPEKKDDHHLDRDVYGLRRALEEIAALPKGQASDD